VAFCRTKDRQEAPAWEAALTLQVRGILGPSHSSNRKAFLSMAYPRRGSACHCSISSRATASLGPALLEPASTGAPSYGLGSMRARGGCPGEREMPRPARHGAPRTCGAMGAGQRAAQPCTHGLLPCAPWQSRGSPSLTWRDTWLQSRDRHGGIRLGPVCRGSCGFTRKGLAHAGCALSRSNGA
jgi:hypothetical protein